MKATLFFDFNEDGDQEQYEYLMSCKKNCRNYAIALDNIKNYIRNKIKYDDSVNELVEYHFNEIRELIPEIGVEE